MLLEELRKLPEFVAFEEAVKKNLTKENVYVRSNMPEVGEYLDEDFDDEGNRFYDKRYKSKEQAEEEGIDNLLADDKGLEEWAFEYLPINELVRALVKEIRK